MSVRFLITKEEDNQAQFRDRVGTAMIGFKAKIKQTTTNLVELNNLLLKKEANKKYIDEVYKESILKYKEGISVLKARYSDMSHDMRILKKRNEQLEENLEKIIKTKLDEKDRIIQAKDKEIKKQENFINELCDIQNSFKSTIQDLKLKLNDAIIEKENAQKLLEAAVKQSKKRLELIENLENELGKK
jgi:hypothetical protein